MRLLHLKLAVAAALISAAPRVYAQDGLAGALSRSSLASPANLIRTPFGPTFAAADFDSDNKPDAALLLDNGWSQPQRRLRTIEVHLTGRPNTDLTFESNDPALAIFAQDVNRDGAADIVVEQPLTHKRLQIWLNDGHGDFRMVRTEDFPAPHLSSREGLDSPWQSPDSRVACLSQRASGIAAPFAKFIPFHTPGTADFEPRRIAFSAAPPLFSLALPRAPPLSLPR